MKRTLIIIFILAVTTALSAQTETVVGRMVTLSWADNTVEHLHDDVRHIKVGADGLTVCTHDGTALSTTPLVAGLKIFSYYKEDPTGVADIDAPATIGVRVAARTAYISGIPAEGARCAVYNAQGMMLIESSAAPGSTQHIVDLSTLARGFYIITVGSTAVKIKID